MSILLLYVNIYLLALYCHPEDRGFGTSLFCKLIVVLGLTLSWAQVLLLPVDIANQRFNQGLDMLIAWEIIYWSVLVMNVFIIPLSIFLYESDEDKACCKRICIAFCQEIIVIILSLLCIILPYIYLNKSKIPVIVRTQTAMQFQHSNRQKKTTKKPKYFSTLLIQPQNTYITTLDIPVSIIVFIVALMCLVGYFFLIFFGGIGLTALPLDLICSYRYRPIIVNLFKYYKRSAQEANEKRRILKEKTDELIKISQQLKDDDKEIQLSSSWFKGRSAGKLDSAIVNFEKQVTLVKEEELNIQDSNPLVYCCKVLTGLILLCVAILWWIHILLFIIIQKNDFPYHSFLNKMFIELELYNVNFLGVGFLGFFSLYLIWSVTKGNTKCSLSIPYILKIHPMIINQTWMNSFLFNVALILFSSIAVVHFCITCFSQYARFSTIEDLFGVQIQHLVLIKWGLEKNIFVIVFFGWSIFTFIIQCCCLTRKPGILRDLEIKRQNYEKRAAKQYGTEIELREYLMRK